MWDLPIFDDDAAQKAGKREVPVEESFCVRIRCENEIFSRDIGPFDNFTADNIMNLINRGQYEPQTPRIVSSLKVPCTLECPNFLRQLAADGPVQ